MDWYGNSLPYHFELCLGKKGLVKLLLQEAANNFTVHYMNDLYNGRLQLLENDLEGAGETFSRLMENVNRYGAKNRLIFQ